MMKSTRDEGIDLLKAISIILVLIWHLKPVTSSMLPAASVAGMYGWPVMDCFYRYVTLLAVPTFICVSLHLFIKNSFTTAGYWKKRLLRLIQLFIVWTGIQFIFYLLAGGKLPLPLGAIVPGGGPELPHAGGSVFYFLFVLILCTIWTALFLKLSETLKAITSVAVAVLTILHFAFAPVYGLPIDSMAMENYYIYIPIAYYLTKYPHQFRRFRIPFIAGYILAVLYEGIVLNNFVAAYGRLSVLFGVLSMISLVVSKEHAHYRPVAFLSRYSLGIFAVHKYWMYLVVTFAAVIETHVQLSPALIAAEPPLFFIVISALTFLTVYLLSKTKMKVYIS